MKRTERIKMETVEIPEVMEFKKPNTTVYSRMRGSIQAGSYHIEEGHTRIWWKHQVTFSHEVCYSYVANQKGIYKQQKHNAYHQNSHLLYSPDTQ